MMLKIPGGEFRFALESAVPGHGRFEHQPDPIKGLNHVELRRWQQYRVLLENKGSVHLRLRLTVGGHSVINGQPFSPEMPCILMRPYELLLITHINVGHAPKHLRMFAQHSVVCSVFLSPEGRKPTQLLGMATGQLGEPAVIWVDPDAPLVALSPIGMMEIICHPAIEQDEIEQDEEQIELDPNETED